MRRGYNGSIWRNDEQQVIAVNLGSDYCAEHEWGIDGIERSFNIQGRPKIKMEGETIKEKLLELLNIESQKKMGIEARRINGLNGYILKHNLNTKGVNVTIDELGTKKKKKIPTWGIYVQNSYYSNDEVNWKRIVEWYNPEKDEICGHWCGNDFAFVTGDKQVVTDLMDAFEKNDIAIFVGSSGPFRNGGLIIAIISRLPKDYLDDMRESDIDTIELQKFVAKTGIHDILKKSGKRYYALRPRWTDDTKSDVVFWLNPQEQDINNFGWFNIKELESWTKNEGPILKK